ncbi:FGGY-family carbohydrate kinase [Oricola cellulosilytica]|uniref:Carbohydrate kinase n=1 Tax=Oricola cellulosilytica TaxID=1429082 RepID=A0A4R0PFS3_9HYPH|nr:FGGY-family carbohydrate kinase [Oricola cellulosilytica]TCD15265.1 carbohydrate kinase [Oricola cellulosilytica]
MTGKRYVAVIDIGKTNAKLALVDRRAWREIAVRTIPNRVLPGPPYPHSDIEGIWRFLCGALRELNSQHPVGAISITTHGASAVLLDGDGELALPMLDYEHDGPDQLARDYDAVRPPFSETGSPRLASGLNLGAQIFWQSRSFPREFAKARSIVTFPQYWAYRLTGIATTEMTSLGCHTDLWNPWDGSFSSMVEKQGWSNLIAPVRKAGDVLGTIKPEIARATGLSADVSVLCGIHDSNASLYPHLLTRAAPFSVVSSGTWVICMAIGGEAIAPDPARDTLVNVNAFGNPVPSARFMGGREFDRLMQGGPAKASAAEVARVLDEGIMHLPAIENRSGPFQGKDARWNGNVAALSPGERCAAISFYLAMMTAECLSLTGAKGPVIVEGPFAKNRFFFEMLSVATGRSAIASGASATGTSVGAAMLAARAVSRATDSILEVDCGPHGAMGRYADRWRNLV